MPIVSASITFSSLQPTNTDIPVPTKSNKKSSAKYFIASKGLSKAPIETLLYTLCPATLISDRRKQNATT